MDQKDIIEFCECNVLHPDKIEIAHRNLLDNESISLLTLFFKTFSDPTRMKIILALKETELCVCDLSAVINVSQSAVSHQLKTLRENRLVKYRKEGNVVYYSLDDDHVHVLITQAMNHLKHK